MKVETVESVSNHSEIKPGGELLMYHTNDGATPIRVLLDGDTVWLTQKLLAELYHVGVNTINHHIKGIYDSDELVPAICSLRRAPSSRD